MKYLWLLLLILLAGCAPQANDSDPAEVVERYLQAKVAADADTIQALLCAEMESVLARETRTFATVTDVRLDEMACTRVDGSDTVRCEGQIVAAYGAEDNIFPLTTYRVVQEDGEWKWCGEAS